MKPSQSIYDWTGKTILVVEDEEINAYFFQAALNKTNATLIFADSGKKAVECVTSENSIDVILMDIRMPEMDGYSATRQIKSIRPDIPIIAQTAHAMANEREQILEAGCDDYISKPIRFHTLMDVLNRYLK